MNLRKKTVTLPSGLEWTFRETTGSDDDNLSNLGIDAADMIDSYLSAISFKDDKPGVSFEDIRKLRIRDRYALLIMSRIFSLGDNLIFNYQWETGTEEYELDLNRYIWDYSDKDFPFQGHPDYFDQRIQPYDLNLTLSKEVDGTLVEMDYLDGIGERYLLKLPLNKRTINQQLVARKFRVQVDTGFVEAKDFSNFPSRIMSQFRSIYDLHDVPPMGLVHLVDPISGQEISISLLEIRDFFFPTKI